MHCRVRRQEWAMLGVCSVMVGGSNWGLGCTFDLRAHKPVRFPSRFFLQSNHRLLDFVHAGFQPDSITSEISVLWLFPKSPVNPASVFGIIAHNSAAQDCTIFLEPSE